MRKIALALLTFALLLVQGCATSSKQPQHIEIFRDGERPSRSYKEIGILTDDGGLAEQGGIEAQMIRKARRAGADALLFEKMTQTGDELKGFGLQKTYLYKAHMIVYE